MKENRITEHFPIPYHKYAHAEIIFYDSNNVFLKSYETIVCGFINGVPFVQVHIHGLQLVIYLSLPKVMGKVCAIMTLRN